MELETIVANTNTTKVRRATLEGRPHLVVPTTMLVEGVLNGSKGPLYYPKEEMAKNPQAWDHRPVVVYHPTKNGKPAKAADPVVLNTQKIGITLNSKFVDTPGKPAKWRTEAWLDEERTKEFAPGVYDLITKGKPVEVSTGLYTENELKPGKFGEKKYDAIARGYVPDHLAVLPTGVGACSIQDGAGLLVNKGPTLNAMSYSRMHQTLQKQLTEKYGEYRTSVQDVYPSFVIFGRRTDSGDMKLFKQQFKTDKRRGESEQVTLTGDADPVERVTEYRTPEGTFVGNALYSGTLPKELPMTKAEQVTSIIANSGGQWTKDDESFLLSKSEEWLNRLLSGGQSVTASGGTAAGVVANQQQAPAPARVPTWNELYSQADPATQEALREAVDARNRERASLSAVITANAKNTLTKEALDAMPLPNLRAMAALAAPATPGSGAPNFSGQAGAVPVLANNQQQAAAPPVLPTPPSTKKAK